MSRIWPELDKLGYTVTRVIDFHINIFPDGHVVTKLPPVKEEPLRYVLTA